MAGHMGARNRTQQNLEVVRTDPIAACCSSRARCPGSQGRLADRRRRDQAAAPRERALSGRPGRARTSRSTRSSALRRAWSTTPRSTKSRRFRATRKSRRSPPSRKPALRSTAEAEAEAEAEAGWRPRPMTKLRRGRGRQARRRRKQGRLSDEGQGSDPRRQGWRRHRARR